MASWRRVFQEQHLSYGRADVLSVMQSGLRARPQAKAAQRSVL